MDAQSASDFDPKRNVVTDAELDNWLYRHTSIEAGPDDDSPLTVEESYRLVLAMQNLRLAVLAAGVLPEGYCWCDTSRQDATKPEHEHVGECRELRRLLGEARTLETS